VSNLMAQGGEGTSNLTFSQTTSLPSVQETFRAGNLIEARRLQLLACSLGFWYLAAAR